jgi:thiopeptide-type bacteriocin biosynthesis protein
MNMNTTLTTSALTHQGFFHLRAPLLSTEVFKQWDAAPDKVAFLLEQFKAPRLREALYLASPNLYDRLVEWEASRHSALPTTTSVQINGMELNAPGLPAKAEQDKFVNALSRYLARAAYRCTPFAMFSTVTLGQIAGETDFTGLAEARLARHIQFDAWLEQLLLAKVVSDPNVRETIEYFPNPTAIDLRDQYYYTEMRAKPVRAAYVLSVLQKTQALELTLNAAREGLSIAGLAAIVARECEVDVADARAFVGELIEHQLLVPSLGIPVIGGKRLRGLHTTLEALGHAHHTADLVGILDGLQHKAGCQQESSLLEDYRHAADGIAAADVPAGERDALFQVDCRRDFSPTLSGDLVDEIAASSTALIEFGWEPLTNLDEHKRLFSERFGEREVPLVLALHSEIGIPFPSQTKAISDLLEGLQLGGRYGERQHRHNLARAQVLTACLERTIRTGENVIEITDADLDQIRRGAAPPPPVDEGLFSLVTLTGNNSGKSRFVVNMAAGRSGAEMLGRFTAIDEQLSAKVKDMLRQQEEADPEHIYAEINHHAGGRVNNILARDTLRDYEIVCLGTSSLDSEHQIHLSDLMLRLENGQYRLRSKRLNKDIKPRMTTAHNYSYATHGTYHFLCSLQWQERPSMGAFQWPDAFATIQRLPRVCYRNSVWALARWRFTKSDTDALTRVAGDIDATRAWRAARALPRFVTLDFGDNCLPVDLDNPVLVQMLLEEIRGADRWELTESAALNDNWEDGQTYSREVMVPFAVRPATPREQAPSLPRIPVETGHRPGVFPPGSEWSFFKIYGGPLLADALLTETIAPILKRAHQDGQIDSWFFIRYSDPESHLRVRFHSTDDAQRQRVINTLTQALTPTLHDFRCSRLMMDTYEQELERYGGLQAITLAEQLFHIDSEVAAQLLSMVDRLDEPPERWLVTLLGIQSWLQAFNLSQEEELQVMNDVSNGFKYEFGVGSAQKVQLGTKFRGYRRLIDAHFFTPVPPPAGQAIQALLRDALPARRAIVARLRELEESGQLTMPVNEMVQSYLHMFCNRMLPTSHRQYEVVLYDFMVRVLMSKQSRKQPAAKPA